MAIQTELLKEIRSFLKGKAMAETTFGRLAVNDGKFVNRLKNNKNLTYETVERVRKFMADYPLERDRKRAGRVA